MRLQIMSDLHLRFWGRILGAGWFNREFLPSIKTDADVLVLAGDIVDLTVLDFKWSMARLTSLCAHHRDVIYVPGNHEFYGTSIEEGLQRLLAAAPGLPGLHVLAPGTVLNLGGRRFLGGTMWYPPAPEGTPTINDHWNIENLDPEAYIAHDAFRMFLHGELREGDIVVSHHTPSERSIPEQFKHSPYNHWFCAPEMEAEYIATRRPALWVHGHTHSPFDYQLHGTRVVCNPLGYPGEEVSFNPQFMVEL